MKRREFERVTPESVGIPSGAINRLLDKLESGYTEPHGLQIMRHGKICAEGWWAPYAQGIRHGLQSHTKTYAATAVGIAYTEGILKLDERIIDIFPEYAPENPSENLKKLTVHHVLSMGCGMETMPAPTENWIRDFLATPVVHEPGTTYMYNSVGSTLLGAIVRQKTGLGLNDYLKPRLFDKLGIDDTNLRWMKMPDGMEIGGGGLFATIEDNLRLLKLYADGGVWEGERILAEDYVKLATTLQNDSATEAKNNPPAKDNFVGYGYQLWMCRPKGVYRADGAMGQFTIVVPDRDMIIAITETAAGMTGGEGPQKTLDYMWEFLDEIPVGDGEPMPDTEETAAVKKRLGSLILPKPPVAPYGAMRPVVNEKWYDLESGYLHFGDTTGIFMGGEKPVETVKALYFKFLGCINLLDYNLLGNQYQIIAALDGGYQESYLRTGAPKRILSSGWWPEDNLYRLQLRLIDSCYTQVFDFRFEGDTVTVEKQGKKSPFEPQHGPAVFRLRKEQ